MNAVIVPEGDGRWMEYAGGYTDMLAQRGADIAGRAGEKREAVEACEGARRTRRSPRGRSASA